MLMNKRIFFLIIGFILILNFVSAEGLGVQEAYALDHPPDAKGEIDRKACSKIDGCWYEDKCYNFGRRIIEEPEQKYKNIAWINISYLYCGEKKTKYHSSMEVLKQKVVGETCENDFECESNECSNEICEQKRGIEIVDLYNKNRTIIKNITISYEELFYFQGLKYNYSIGFGRDKNNSIIIWMNNNTNYSKYDKQKKKNISLENYGNLFNYNKEYIPIKNNTYLFFNNFIYKEGSINDANFFFMETDDPVDNPKLLIEQLLANETIGEINETQNTFLINNSNGSLISITGNVIGEKENFFSKLFSKMKNWFK